MPDTPIGPEDYGDQLDRLVRILVRDASGTVEPLLADERNHYHDQLDTLLSGNVTPAVIACITHDTRSFLLSYIGLDPQFASIRRMINNISS